MIFSPITLVLSAVVVTAGLVGLVLRLGGPHAAIRAFIFLTTLIAMVAHDCFLPGAQGLSLWVGLGVLALPVASNASAVLQECRRKAAGVALTRVTSFLQLLGCLQMAGCLGVTIEVLFPAWTAAEPSTAWGASIAIAVVLAYALPPVVRETTARPPARGNRL